MLSIWSLRSIGGFSGWKVKMDGGDLKIVRRDGLDYNTPTVIKEKKMSIRKAVGAVMILIAALSFGLAGQQPRKAEFDGQVAYIYNRELSTDAMWGRRSGHEGEIMATQYIANKFKSWGIEPAFPGSYIQDFTLEYNQLEPGAVLEIIGPRNKREYIHGEDWRVQSYSGSGTFAAEVVFVGYGVHAASKGYDDYAGVNVRDKVVLFQVPVPAWLDEKCGADTELSRRVRAAQTLGARAAMTYRPASGGPAAPSRTGSMREAYNKDFVVLSAEQKVVDFIFKFMPTELRVQFQRIDQAKKGAPMESGTKAVINVKYTHDPARTTHNVVGKITGSDVELRNEYVVIGAHLDAVAWDAYGEINNGADDNASGTAVTMEIARVLKLNGAQPKRTIVFGLWGGEEQGLLGSRYFCDNPPFPMDKVAASFNMDMVGQGNGQVSMNGQYYGPEVWDILSKKLSKELLAYTTPGRGGPGGSDHTPFLEKGVMAYSVSAQGNHLKYHQAYDEIALIKPEQLKRIGDVCLESALIIANEQADFFPPLRRETYYFRNQTMINYELTGLPEVLAEHKDAKDSWVDLQFAIIPEKQGMSGDGLRTDLVRELWTHPDRFKPTNLTIFGSTAQVSGDNRQGKTAVIRGLRAAAALQDDPRWAEVLVKQGIFFAALDKPAFMFSGKVMSEEGKKLLDAAEKAGLLLLISGLDNAQAKALFEAAKKGVVQVAFDIPSKDVLELAKKKNFAVGLALKKGENPMAYFKRLEAAKKIGGTETLMFVNEECLWKDASKTQVLNVISEMLKAKYPASDMTNLFSGTLFRMLNKVKVEEAMSAPPGRPF